MQTKKDSHLTHLNCDNPLTYSNHCVHHFLAHPSARTLTGMQNDVSPKDWLDMLVDDGELVRHARGRLALSNIYSSDAIEHDRMGAGVCCSNHFWLIDRIHLHHNATRKPRQYNGLSSAPALWSFLDQWLRKIIWEAKPV